MGLLRIIEPGMFTTVQDFGRRGFAHIGVPAGGAADALSQRVGNRLVGNADGAAGLEMTLVGGVLEFGNDARVSVCGGTCEAVVIAGDGTRQAAPLRRPLAVRAGDRLSIGAVTRGARVYVNIAGGLNVPVVLASRSTLVGAGIGGVGGRPLRGGDAIEWADDLGTSLRIREEFADEMVERVLSRRTLRAVVGSHAGEFDSRTTERFWSSEFTVSSRSDRTGVRLQGAIGSATSRGMLASEGMMCGAVQVPPGGEPIILGVEHPTTGGYPVIASIATVDLPVLGQLRPHERVGFERIEHDAALALLCGREARLSEGTP